jgi:hypothetical protein
MDINYEIFNKKESFVNSENNKLLLEKYGENYIDFIHKNGLYSETLKYLAENSNKEFLLFKLFAAHVSSNVLDNLIKDDLIDYIIIYNRKNILDRYISHRKAKKMNKWDHIDTSNIQIHFDPEHYIEYKKNHINVYELYFKLSRNKKYIYIDYNETLEKELFFKKIKDFIPELNIKPDKSYQLEKQDNANYYCQKISNYNEVEKFITHEVMLLNKS